MEPPVDNAPLGSDAPPDKLKSKFILCVVVVLLLVGGGMFYLAQREPRYNGRTLTEWLAWFDQVDAAEPGLEEAKAAIRAMGAKSVPQLLVYLKPLPSTPPLLDRLDNWTSDQLDISLPVPRAKDRQYPALAALEILGPAAEPAIPQLTAMLGDTSLGRHAADCLAAIGPAAIPALTNALASTNTQARVSALFGLGEMGLPGELAAPMVAARMHDPVRFVGVQAVVILGEMGPAAEKFIPDLEQLLTQKDRGEAAAVTLARLGHTAVLVRALTNDNEEVRDWIGAALDPRLDAMRLEERKFFTDNHYKVNVNLLLQFMTANQAGIYHIGSKSHLTDILLAHFNDPDPVARALIADEFGAFRLNAVRALPALTNALSDKSELVRRSAAAALAKFDVDTYHGGIIRGPRKEKKIALEFTAHTFAEGAPVILDELAKHHAHASFFVTGDFLVNPEFRPLVQRIVREGHYLGPHSDKHVLYCAWDNPKNTSLTRAEFERDVALNKMKVRHFADESHDINYWLPAFEWYNQEIVDWSHDLNLTLVNYTPGTRSNADYTRESDTNFVSSQKIYDSIIQHEQTDPNGLNGFLLLLHLGSGPGRTDKMSDHFGALLDYLSGKGYQFVRIDELLDTP